MSGALIHQAGGRGAEVADLLHRALKSEGLDPESLASGGRNPAGPASRVAAAAYRELGYLSVQRGIPDRAAGWLEQAAVEVSGLA